MNKIMNLLNWVLNGIVNLVLIAGLVLLIAWAVWDVPPQVSLEKTAHFFSNSWHLITGTETTKEEKAQVTAEQLEDSAKKTVHFYEK